MDSQIEFPDVTDSQIRFTKFNHNQNLGRLKVSCGIKEKASCDRTTDSQANELTAGQ